jgi:mono/diheme cytochrome c family protein
MAVRSSTRIMKTNIVLLTAVATCSGLAGCTHLKYGFAKNPLEPTAETLSQGKDLYERHCSSCHGEGAAGDGNAGKGLPATPTNLVMAQRNWSDGVFHIRMIAKPKNGMPSFRETLLENERWRVVHYVRSLDTDEKR